MKIEETGIPDLLIVHPRVFEDERGYFYESYNKRTFHEHGLEYNFVQDNEALSSYGVLRGLHFQKDPYAQAKLVRVTEGKVLDVAVDLRRGSPTYGQHRSVELSEENKWQLMVPRGFAHGYVVLSERAVFCYKCDRYYEKSSEGGVMYNDPDLNIDWLIPNDQLIISAKDQQQSYFKEVDHNFTF